MTRDTSKAVFHTVRQIKNILSSHRQRNPGGFATWKLVTRVVFLVSSGSVRSSLLIDDDVGSINAEFPRKESIDQRVIRVFMSNKS